ncbi:hypothetical protein LMTR3_20950 [Bradyrhizobium sp. LMTR 3]|nr:hypothetical protein LMTR3_20950 [Bradyrhizobium sp. LMTR 3]
MMRQLAAVLSAKYGCSGPLAQKGWATSARQSGHTGKIIRPELFIGAGSSGGILHRVGVKGADLIFAISIDKNALIFELAYVGSDANRLLATPMAAFARVCGRIRAFRSRARGSCHDRGKVRRHLGRRRDSRHASVLPRAKLDMKAFRPKRGEFRPRPVPLHDPEKWPPVFE